MHAPIMLDPPKLSPTAPRGGGKPLIDYIAKSKQSKALASEGVGSDHLGTLLCIVSYNRVTGVREVVVPGVEGSFWSFCPVEGVPTEGVPALPVPAEGVAVVVAPAAEPLADSRVAEAAALGLLCFLVTGVCVKVAQSWWYRNPRGVINVTPGGCEGKTFLAEHYERSQRVAEGTGATVAQKKRPKCLLNPYFSVCAEGSRCNCDGLPVPAEQAPSKLGLL